MTDKRDYAWQVVLDFNTRVTPRFRRYIVQCDNPYMALRSALEHFLENEDKGDEEDVHNVEIEKVYGTIIQPFWESAFRRM